MACPSRSFISLRSFTRHSVMAWVIQMNTTTVTAVAATSSQPKIVQKITLTTTSSIAVGAMLNSRKYSMELMDFVPRSTTRVISPVRRARWKRNDRRWRRANTSSVRPNTASCPTRLKVMLRS